VPTTRTQQTVSASNKNRRDTQTDGKMWTEAVILSVTAKWMGSHGERNNSIMTWPSALRAGYTQILIPTLRRDLKVVSQWLFGQGQEGEE